MPVIGFKKEFVPGIKSGKKPQTIRPAGKRKYKPGDRLYMYTGPYRPGERIKIGEAVVSEVVPIRLDRVFDNIYVVLLAENGNHTHHTNYSEVAHKIAKDDGFGNYLEFEHFFIKGYKLKERDTKPFNIIKWTNFEPA
jgi:hypothetical protein